MSRLGISQIRECRILVLAFCAFSAFGQNSTTIRLASSKNPSVFGQPIILSAVVTPAQAAGKVTFYDGTTILGMATLSNGSATISVIPPNSGVRSLKAHFSGGSGYASSTSSVLSQTVDVTAATTLRNASSYTTANTINQHIAVADFNGDGHLDIVTNNYTVLMGNGDGTFQAPVIYPADKSAYAVATGDFNGDGKPDFATAGIDGNVGIWLNKGDGTFGSQVPYSIGAAPLNISIADLNNDGIADIAVASRQGQSTGIGILLGVGDGTFKPVVTYLTGQRERGLAIADFNGDGNADIVAISSDDIIHPVTILLGNGDGTFQATGTNYPAAFPEAVAVGDFNKDGKPDFVVVNFGVYYLSVFLGNGDGSFSEQPVRLLTPALSPPFDFGLTVGDFDGDGNPDIAYAGTGGSTISVYLGLGDGTFRGAVNFSAGSNAQALVAAEFNGDGRTDIAVTNSASVQILLAGTGDFPVVTTTSLPDATGGVPYSAPLNATGGTQPYTWALSAGTTPVPLSSTGTIAGTPPIKVTPGIDSLTVMVSGSSGPGFYSSQNLSIRVSDAFVVSYPGDYVGEVGSVYSGDLQAVGGAPPYKNWMVTAGSLPPGLVLDPSSGTFSGAPGAAGTFSFTVTVNDSAGSTSLPANISIFVVPRVAITTPSLPDGFAGVPYFVVLAATGGFPPYKWSVNGGTLPPGLTLDPAAGVITGTPANFAGSPFTFNMSASDGSANSTLAFTIRVLDPLQFKMTLTSSASPSGLGQPITLTASLTPPTASGKVTFYDDTAVLGVSAIDSGQAVFTTRLLAPGTHRLHASFVTPVSAALLQLVHAHADASLEVPVGYASANPNCQLTPVVVADFNGDGNADLATLSSVLLGNGDGTLQAPIAHPVEVNPVALVVRDFDENGKPDIAITGASGLQVFLGKGDGTFANPAIYTGGPGFAGALAAADFNGDGHEDLIVGISSGQPAQLYLGVGDGTFRPALNVMTGVDYAAAIGAADFNGDGRPDIVVVGSSSPGQVSAKLNVLLGKGDGTFQAPSTYIVTANNAGASPSTVVTSDLNGDGNTDLLVFGPAVDRVSVLLGRGDGTFRNPAEYLLGPRASGSSISVSDFDGDGFLDLVLADAGNSLVTILPGNGDGSFRPPVSYPAGSNSNFFQLAAGDFNGDGRMDIATATSAGRVNVLLGSPIAGNNQLTVSPAAINVTSSFGSAVTTQTVTLSYQTTTSSAPAFTSAVNIQNFLNWISASPASGTMTLVSHDGSLYTYTAQVTITLNPASSPNGFVYLASVNLAANGATATVPVIMNLGNVPQTTGITNAASAGQAPPAVVAAGSYLTIYGTGLSGSGEALASAVPLPVKLNGTSATLGGIPMPLLYASNGQVNGLVPQALGPNNSYPLVISTGNGTTAPVMVMVKELQPGIYTADNSGSGPGIVANALSGQLIDVNHPAHVGDNLTIYCTGLGPVQGPNGESGPADGAAAPTNFIFRTASSVTANLGGLSAPVLFSGLAPGFVALYQVNIQVPPGIASSGALPLVVTASDSLTGATARSNTVTIAVQ